MMGAGEVCLGCSRHTGVPSEQVIIGVVSREGMVPRSLIPFEMKEWQEPRPRRAGQGCVRKELGEYVSFLCAQLLSHV